MNFGPKQWLISIAIVLAVLLGWNFLSNNQQETTQPVTTAVTDSQVETAKATITINPGSEGQVLSIQDIEIKEGTTALDFTRSIADVETSGEGEMAFVTSIDGRVADASKNEFWKLVVNGESSQVGAGSYKVQDDDEIEWRISTF